MDKKNYTSIEFAELCNSKQRTVLLWAKNHNVNYIGTGRRKIYLFTQEDIERFNAREKPGRRWT